jgi:type II secretory pathway pseudopilin PulG
MLRGSRASQGMTIVEALVAMLILGCATSAVLSLIVTGDRIAGRRSGISYATMVAKNAVERLKNYEISATLPADTDYSDTVNGQVFLVSRVRVLPGPIAPDSIVQYGEYSISVNRTGFPTAPLAMSFRILQGFHGEQPH